MKRITSKLPQVGTTIFTTMSALAHEQRAINLSQGFPNYPCDPALIQLVDEAMRSGSNQYARMAGMPQLCEAIASLVKHQYDAVYDSMDEITITSGATEGLFCAIMAFLQVGDEVIVLEPAYDSYLPAIQLSGAKAVRVPLQFPTYRVDWDRVRDALGPRTKAIILNTPHNPTGQIFDESDIQTLQEIVQRHDLLLISDEVYEFITFDGHVHQSLARYPDLAERSIVIGSFGKSLHATGWKVGYCLARKTLSTELRKVHQYLTFSTSTPFQVAIAQYLEDHQEKVLGLPNFFQEKRDLFLDLMKGSRFEPLACRGTYFQLMRYDKISNEHDLDFAKRITREHKVATIPISVFYADGIDNKVIRFCFAKDDETLKAAAEKLCDV